MIGLLLLSTSLTLQAVAAALAIRLAWVTERAFAWSCISTALVLMTVRRVVTLRGALPSAGGALDMKAEVIALGISICMVVGVAAIAPRFRARSATEKALAQIREVVGAIVESAPTAMVVTDKEGLVQLWNPAAVRLFGWSSDEVVGKTLPNLPSEQAIELAPRAGAEVRGVVTRGLRKDGTTVPIRLDAAPIGSRDDGKTHAAVYMSVDLSQIVLLEAQLQHAQRLELVGRLAGGVAHDFNNLLTAICGYAELAKADTRDPRLLEAIEQILFAGQRASLLTRQLLAFSRSEVVQPRVVDLNAILRELRPMLTRLIGEDIDLEMRLHPDECRVRADVGQLHQVAMNLVLNARDAMPGGGRIQITTGASPERVLLRVSDEGAGMTGEVKRHLFEPFFTTKERGRGTGLGLSTVWGIVQHAGGSIEVESEPGEGATFSVWLPRTEAPLEAEVSRGAQLRGPSGVMRTILVVEDEGGVLTLAREILERAGYRVIAVGSAEEALRAAEVAGEIDLLVTDVGLPQINGRELAERLNARLPGLKVLFTSGYADSVVSRYGLERSGASLLSKPYTVSGLENAVARTLASPGGSVQPTTSRPG